MPSNNTLVPTRKGDAPLLAAQRGVRWRMNNTARPVIKAVAVACVSIAASCATADSVRPVLRIEYATVASADGTIEHGVVFWRRELIQGAEVPGDLLQNFSDGYPVSLQLEGKLANTCYVTSRGFGLALLKRTESHLSGPLWFTADWAWGVDFSLELDGMVRGTMDSTALRGRYREVEDFSECYERARSAMASSAPPKRSLERTREK
jgi:hypothetical protein